MVRFHETGASPFEVPAGARTEMTVHTGTSCLALMDVEHVAEVWEDLLYDGHDHDHGSGGLMLNKASVGTHIDHDGDFPVELTVDEDGRVMAFRVNLDPYAEDLLDVRDSHSSAVHVHLHSHDGGEPHAHEHGHDDDHDHEHTPHGHADGWSAISTVQLTSDRALLGDPAGLPEADDIGGLVDLVFPAAGGTLTVAVFTDGGIRRVLAGVWAA